MKTTVKKSKSPEKKSTKTESKSPVKIDKKTGEIKVVGASKSLHDKISNLETAYIAALNGKLKFSEVKEIFKKLHKEVKSFKK